MLPRGFGLAAIAAERLLPADWPNRRRCIAGGLLATASAAVLALPSPPAVTTLLLSLLGIGLGTALGVAAVSLSLHAGATAAPAMLTLGAFGLAATAAGQHTGAGKRHRDRPGGAKGHQ
ncbi:MAG TPA: hypothetical protein VFQ44_30770 [Streptosporangiaceae bacterium]|nr:hypothetical protein [Streptosporangiaceae bacterium]